jgi:hypothetical protein
MNLKSTDLDSNQQKSWTIGNVSRVLVLLTVVYLLSSGPLLALALKLREWTGRDEFYLAVWGYLPLFLMGHDTPFDAYVSWWCDLFNAVGPG